MCDHFPFKFKFIFEHRHIDIHIYIERDQRDIIFSLQGLSLKGSKSLVTLLPLPPLPPLPGFLGQRQSDQKLQIWAVSSNHDTNTNISSPKIALTTKAISSLKNIQFMVVHTIYIVEASYNEPQPSPSRKDFIPSHLVTIQKYVTYSSFPEILATSNLSSPKTR